jgi:hypothetical protein
MDELKSALALARAHAMQTEARIAEQLVRLGRPTIVRNQEELRAVETEIAQLERILSHIKAGVDGIRSKLGQS